MGFDPLSLGVIAAGAGLAGTGKYLGDKSAQKQAQREADARNAVVAQGVQKQGEYATANRGDFNTGMTAFAPGAQDLALGKAQDTRTAGNVGNMKQETGADIPITDSSSPAVRGEIAKRLLSTFQQSTDRAKASGKLGGYADQQLGNNLGIAQTGRDIGTRNTQANLDASLIAPKADLAATGVYKPPSPWGNILQFAGNALGAYGGRMGGTPGAPLMPSPNGPNTFSPMFR